MTVHVIVGTRTVGHYNRPIIEEFDLGNCFEVNDGYLLVRGLTPEGPTGGLAVFAPGHWVEAVVVERDIMRSRVFDRQS